jgi:microcystin-dependent protein
MDSPFVSAIVPWPLDWAPVGFAACNGQQLAVNQYMALYSLIGVTYGGTANVNFNVPDLRGRMMVGMGLQPNPPGTNYQLGQWGGVETNTLITNNLPPMPPHTHGATFTPTGGGGGTPLSVTVDLVGGAPTATTTNTVAAGTSPYYLGSTNPGVTAVKGPYTTTAPTAATKAPLGGITASGGGGGITGGTVGIQGASAYSGSPQAFENRSPFLVLNFIIAVNGLYPPRP